ncbi:hypothetical protein HN385_02060 [archaeon]|nr:hypothetical protein [archaeon]MBT3450338.1 hypothetical protein [archaeon]MBT6868887.1 hypothetical protein [archaeon]MBT7192892.1 hypothetical protein [archaeon]MBT7380858.1 hypothetical protein [archaeon]
MPKLIKISTGQVRSTQDYLEQSTINFYLSLRESNVKLPPIPVVESICYEGKYDLIDGHHNVALAHMLGEDVELLLIDSPRELLKIEQFPKVEERFIESCNEQIQKRFNSVPFYVPCDCQGEDITCLDQLIKYSDVRLR